MTRGNAPGARSLSRVHRPAAPYARRRRLGAALLAAIAMLAVPVSGGSDEEAVSGGLQVVGRLPVLSPPERTAPGGTWQVSDTTLVLNTVRRRAFQLFRLTPRTVPGQVGSRTIDRIGIRTFDLDTLRPLAYVVLDHEPHVASNSGEWLHAQDEERGLLYLVSGRRQLAEHEARPSGRSADWQPGDVVVLDERLLERGADPVARRIRLTDSATFAQRNWLGITVVRDGDTTRVFGVFSPRTCVCSFFDDPIGPYVPGVGIPIDSRPLVAEIEAVTGATEWSLDVDACRGGTSFFPDRTWSALLVSKDRSRVYLSCNVQDQLNGVIRITLGPDRRPTLAPEVFPGPLFVKYVFADPAGERMLMVSARKGQNLVVFDGATSRYVGAAGLAQSPTQPIAYGIDRASGRFYALTPDHLAQQGSLARPTPVQGGLYMVDSRLSPVPQAVNPLPDLGRPAQPTILIDPARDGRPRRIFVRRANGSERTPEKEVEGNQDPYVRYPDGRSMLVHDDDFYLVVEDRLPVADPPTLGDLDRLTVPVPERRGVTAPSFDAAGSGYGARVRFVGGLAATARLNPDVIENTLNEGKGTPPCLYTDRDWQVGAVHEAQVTDLQAGARASGAEVDGQTKADMLNPSSRCAPAVLPPGVPTAEIDGVAGRRWEIEPATCTGNGEASQRITAQGEVGAFVNCAQSSGGVEANGQGRLDVAGVVSVAAATSSVRIERDAERGIVVVSEAVARGVSIAGVRIDAVRSVSEVWSNGRPSADPRAKHLRVVCGVHAPGFTREPCGDPAPVIELLNARLGNRGKVRLPEPDPEYLKGSPGGYVAGVTKRRQDEAEDRIINRDYQKEVPGLEVVLYRDSTNMGLGRQIVQLAGVRAVATYGIQCIPPFEYDARAGDCAKVRFDAGGDAVPPPPVVEEPPVTDAPPPTQPLPPTVSEPGVVRVVRTVTGFLFRSLPEGLLAAAVWFSLGLPFFLAFRRSALGRAVGGRG